MALDKSPSFEAYDGDELLPSGPKPEPKPELNIPYRSIGIALVVAAVLLVLAVGIGSMFATHYGSVQGTVRDIDGNPLQVQITISGMTGTLQTDNDGRFIIHNVPSGAHDLTVSAGSASYVFQISVPQESNFSIGQIQVDTDA